MQLMFPKEEYGMLIDILLKREFVELKLSADRHRASPLLQKALAHELTLDIAELEDLEEILKDHAATLAHSAARCESQESRDKVLQEQRL